MFAAWVAGVFGATASCSPAQPSPYGAQSAVPVPDLAAKVLLHGMQVCLELLIAVALRNRDRIVLIWPLIHEYLNAIMTPNGAKAANPLVARVSLPFTFAIELPMAVQVLAT